MACLWTWHALSTCPVDMFAVFILRAKQIRQCDSVGGVKPSATLEPFGFRTRHEPFSIITVMTLSCNNRIHIIQSCTIHSQLAAKDQKLPKKTFPDVNWEQRHSLGGLQEVQACCSLLPPTSTQVDFNKQRHSPHSKTLSWPLKAMESKQSVAKGS